MRVLSVLLLLISNYCFSQVKPGNSFPVHKPVVNKPQHDPPEVVNIYTEALAYDICTNQITVANDSGYFAGDTVLLIQMKGAIIDTSNTAAFGAVLDYRNAGNYEFNIISQKTGNVLTLKNKLTKAYDIPTGVVQLIRVPSYKTGNFNGGLTCNPWDGTKGGVLAVFGKVSLQSAEDIDVSGKGFRGGEGYNSVYSSSTCNQNNYTYPSTSQFAGFKGESIASFSQNYSKGKGSLAAGGGGGNSHNAGGGGGGNGGIGGFGGYQTDSCGTTPFDNRGIGGKNLTYASTAGKIFLGSGGGAGHIDNASYPTSGGAGGGIIIVVTPDLIIYDNSIIANGFNGTYCYGTGCNDGMGGGGAGGTILLSANQVITPDGITVLAQGGDGGNIISTIVPGGRAGPGGGGGGGVFYYAGSTLPLSITYLANGGNSGIIALDSNNPHGATKGNDGFDFFDLVLPVDTVAFSPNIDSVRIKDSVNYCNNILFKGSGYTNTYPVASWQWYFGDGGTANTQNIIHNYNAVGTYNVKLIVTDINGCKDSIVTSVNSAGPMVANAGADTTLCASGQILYTLNGSGTGTYLWQPAALLNNNTLQNPVATINTLTTFYLTVSNGTGCTAIDDVSITVNQNPVVKTLGDTSICKNIIFFLSATGATNYNWSPGIYVSDSTIANPLFTDTISRSLIVTGTAVNGCKASDTININVNLPVVFKTPPDKSICAGSSIQLDGNNGTGVQYLWSPPSYLSNTNIINPIANPPSSTPYTVNIKDNICNTDSSFIVTVTVMPLPVIKATKSNDVNCTISTSQLQASGASQYSWIPAATLNNSQVFNPIASPKSTTTYTVTGTTNAGCISNDSITVLASRNGGLELPNSFTPNDDGKNDCFGIKYPAGVQNLNFIIYNYLGQKVFETNNPFDCWNGTFKGKKADMGNYVYYLKANTSCGPAELQGNVLLFR